MPSLQISSSQWNFLPRDVRILDLSSVETIPMFYLFLFVIWSIFWLIGLIWFFCLRDRTEIQMRSPHLVILSAVGAELALLCTTLDIFLSRQHYPCILDLWYIMLFFPLYFVPFVLRFMCYFVKMYQLNRWRKKEIEDPMASPWVRESTWVNILGYFMGCMMTIGSILQFTPPIREWVTTYGCQITPITSAVLIVMFALCLIIVGLGLIYMKNIEDPYKIKSELVTCFITWIVTLGPYILLYWFLPDQRNNTTFLMYIFIISGYFSSVIRPLFLSYRMPPEQQTKDKILDTLEDILLDEEGFSIVEQYSVSQSAGENPPFLKEVIRFKDIDDKNEMKNRARFIYDTFIKPGGPKTINIPAKMVAEISDNLENPTSDMFNLASREVSKLLKTNFLRQIKNLPAYEELVKKRENELKSQEIGNQMYNV